MFWTLLLAHFIGDYFLQTDWMVRNRDKFWVLTLHASIHLGVMLLLIGVSRSEYWPLISLLALIHMGVHTGSNSALHFHMGFHMGFPDGSRNNNYGPETSLGDDSHFLFICHLCLVCK